MPSSFPAAMHAVALAGAAVLLLAAMRIRARQFRLTHAPVQVHSVSLQRLRISLLGRPLLLSLTFSASRLEPIFSGGAWAGTVFWAAARYLCDYILDPARREDLVQGKTVLELGAGVGVPSFAAMCGGGAQGAGQRASPA